METYVKFMTPKNFKTKVQKNRGQTFPLQIMAREQKTSFPSLVLCKLRSGPGKNKKSFASNIHDTDGDVDFCDDTEDDMYVQDHD